MAKPASHKLRIPDTVAALVRGLHPNLKRKVRAGLEEISRDPYCGKGLKAELSGLWSYRVGRLRIVYRVSRERQLEIVAIGPRERIYEETYRLVQR